MISTLSSYVDEYIKISASMSELKGAIKRLGVKFHSLKSWKPSKALLEGNFSTMKAKDYTALGGGAATVPTIRSAKRVLPQIADAAIRTGATLPKGELIAHMKKDMATTLKFGPGTIYLSRGRGSLGSVAELKKKPREALSTIFGIHEGLERAVKPKEVLFGYGHFSPQVLAKEHNMLTTLSGPGAKDSNAFLRKVRALQGDSIALSQIYEKALGDKYRLVYGEGKKIPKAMQKHVMRRLKSDEGLREIWNRYPASMRDAIAAGYSA